MVQLILNPAYLPIADVSEIGLFGEILPDESVGVLIQPFLPRMVEIVEVKDDTKIQNLEFDEDNNLVDDIEKIKLKHQIEKKLKLFSTLDEVLGDASGVTGVRLKNTQNGQTQDVPVHGCFIEIGRAHV